MTSYTDKELAAEAKTAIRGKSRHGEFQFLGAKGEMKTARVRYAGFSVLLSGSTHVLQARGTRTDTGDPVTLNIAI